MAMILQGRRGIVAKLGMDAHWRGAIVVSNALREAGMEVVYLGHVTAADLVAAVRREDPVLVGLSTLSGNHLGECATMVAALRAAGLDDVVIVAGGSIPTEDRPKLLALGVDRVFGVGSRLSAIVEEIAELIEERKAVECPAESVSGPQ